MLNAIFLCLAGVANDVRQDRSVRDRAVTAMESMTARDIFEAGLAGDFGEICIRLQWFVVGDSRPLRTQVPLI